MKLPADGVGASRLSNPASEQLPVAPGVLYLVAVPIGNLEDITLRALRILGNVAVIAAENVAVSRTLLDHYGLKTPLLSYRPRTDRDITDALLARLRGGEAVALVSDAGTPLIADPGLELARRALAEQLPLMAVPGPAAALTALVLSGLAAGRFVFEGFPPRGRADRAEFFAAAAREPRTLLLYETTSHLRDTLETLRRTLGPTRPLLVARDLTRPSETLFYGSLDQACQRFQRPDRGEYTLVVEGAAPQGQP